MKCFSLVFILLAGLIVPTGIPTPAMAEEQARGQSGYPLPRFVSLGSNKANMRSGPGERYPIDWFYKRRGLPLEVIAEYDQVWRKVRDIDGTEGWMHKQLLSGRRHGIITIPVADLRKKAADDSPVILRAEQGVQVRIDRCTIDWCRLEIEDTKGWVEKSALWGIYPDEIFR